MIDVQGLVVRYGDRTAVDGVDLTVAAGEVVALLGRNGAGKTSAVEALEGYRARTGGDLRVLGLDPGRPADRRRLAARIGVMLQNGGVYPAMSPAEALGLFASYYDEPVAPGDLLARLDLGSVAGTPWRRLSGGEQQRLALALALVGRPEAVFLDEPTAGVDPVGRQAIRGEVAALKAGGTATLVTTHELDEAERMADRIVIIDRGRVVAEGTVRELTSAAAGRIRFGAPSGIDTAALGAALGVVVKETGPGAYEVDGSPGPAVIAALTAWLAERDLPLQDLRAGTRLEDVFFSVTGEEG